MSNLDVALLAAHERNDKQALVRLYREAARQHGDDEDRAAFYLTHAYIFALDCGAPEAEVLNRQLAEQGREVLQTF
ncbi:MAG: hypothetical protein AAF903_10325 [Pseudomonadota bacterium]